MARSNFIRRIPARFNFMWEIWGIPVYLRRGPKGRRVWVDEELLVGVDVDG